MKDYSSWMKLLLQPPRIPGCSLGKTSYLAITNSFQIMNLNASGKECKCLHNMLTQHIQENVLSMWFGLLLFCMGLMWYHVARQHTSIPLLSWYAIRCNVGDTSFAWHNLPGPAVSPVDAHELRVNLGGKLLETQCCSRLQVQKVSS